MTSSTDDLDRPYVVTLGTAGGPRWWRDADGFPRQGIATAVVVGDAWYLVDCGAGVGRQITEAGLPWTGMRAVFLTHLHSDHVVDLPSLLLFGAFEFKGRQGAVPIIGPGDRGRLTPLSPRAATTPRAVAADSPTPGTVGLVRGLIAAFATDVNDRIFDSLAPSPEDQFAPRDIDLPANLPFDPDDDVAPAMEPIEIFRDDRVVVTAVLVSHHPTAPAYGFRFDTAAGSMTISGDTAPCENLVTLARDTDLLLHEAISLDSLAPLYTDAEMLRATMDHHMRAHTTPRQAGEIASAAGARRLALHHLVPSWAPPQIWDTARETFDGPVHLPADLEILPFDRGSVDAGAPVLVDAEGTRP